MATAEKKGVSIPEHPVPNEKGSVEPSMTTIRCRDLAGTRLRNRKDTSVKIDSSQTKASGGREDELEELIASEQKSSVRCFQRPELDLSNIYEIATGCIQEDD